MAYWEIIIDYRFVEMYKKYVWSYICSYLCVICKLVKEKNFSQKKRTFIKYRVGRAIFK